MLKSTIIILMLPWIHVLADTCPSAYSQPNRKIQGHVIKTHSMQTSIRCTEKCALHADCHSINYYSSQGICELNNANHLTNPESLAYSADCQYLNYFLRPPSRCSKKLCRHPLVCVIDKIGQSYKCRLSCEDKKEVLSFPRKSDIDKVVYDNKFVLTAFTISMWLQVDTSTKRHTLFSYTTIKDDNEILIALAKTSSFLYLTKSKLTFSFSVVDGQWHHICVTWENLEGTCKFYIDGIRKAGGNAAKGHVIKTGAIILGQDQDFYKGGFDKYESFQGNLTSVNMWDKVLTAHEVSVLASKCPSGEGNFIKWQDFKNKVAGDSLKLICSRFCDSY